MNPYQLDPNMLEKEAKSFLKDIIDYKNLEESTIISHDHQLPAIYIYIYSRLTMGKNWQSERKLRSCPDASNSTDLGFFRLGTKDSADCNPRAMLQVAPSYSSQLLHFKLEKMERIACQTGKNGENCGSASRCRAFVASCSPRP